MSVSPSAITVLVVDDDPHIRHLVELTLLGEGYAVEQAADGPRALERISLSPPSLVLLDLNMPGMSGWEVHARLRESHPQVPVVYMTAHLGASDEARVHGAAAYLPKPFDLDDLLQVVERLARFAAA
jgi:two-component system nitrogen regulation response regulator GlnG